MPRKYIRVADLTPEQLEKKRAKERAIWNRRYAKRKQPRHKSYSPERYKQVLARNAAWAKANRKRVALTEEQLEAKRVYDRNRRQAKAYIFRGSVVAAPSSARDMMLALMDAVPRSDDREDIVAEAALLMLEGNSQSEAIKLARKRVRKDVWQLRNSKQIEACFWL